MKLEDCVIAGQFNQYGSVYGHVIYKRCRFDTATPVVYEHTYNAWTPHDLIMEDCTFRNIRYLINLAGVHMDVAPVRSELNEYCLPNLYMKNCKIYPRDHGIFYLYYSPAALEGSEYYKGVSYLRMIKMENVDIFRDSQTSDSQSCTQLFAYPFFLDHRLTLILDNCNFTRYQHEGQIRLVSENVLMDVLRVHNYKNIHGYRGSFLAKNSFLTLPYLESDDFDFSVESCILFHFRRNYSDGQKLKKYSFHQCKIHLNKDIVPQDIECNASYVDCDFIFYQDEPRMRVSGKGICDMRRCTTNRQQVSTCLTNFPTVEYTEAHSAIIQNELSALQRIIYTSDDSDTVFSANTDHFQYAKGRLSPEMYKQVRLGYTADSKLPYIRNGLNGWADHYVQLVSAGTSVQRPVLDSSYCGYRYFDTTLNLGLIWNGTTWVRENGSRVE
ncbi:MAG: hypothetical protein LUF04_11205 [Bacteroides sp.]|nr:hypothetical protein [Bacteroides sp.]